MGPSAFWLIALVVFLILEAITVGLVSLWFGLGALGALITSFFTGNIWVQIGVFLAVSFVCLLAVRPLVKKYVNPRRVATNADRVIGAEGVVTETIDNLRAQGMASVKGAAWTARSERDECTIPKGAKVTVLRIEGVKVIVAPVEVPSGKV